MKVRNIGVLTPVIFNLGTRRRWVVSITLWPPSSAGYAPEQVLSVWTRGKFLSLARNRPPDCSARSLVTLKQLVHEQLQTTHCAKLANCTQYANMVWARDVITDKSLFIISIVISWDPCVEYSCQLSLCENIILSCRMQIAQS